MGLLLLNKNWMKYVVKFTSTMLTGHSGYLTLKCR